MNTSANFSIHHDSANGGRDDSTMFKLEFQDWLKPSRLREMTRGSKQIGGTYKRTPAERGSIRFEKMMKNRSERRFGRRLCAELLCDSSWSTMPVPQNGDIAPRKLRTRSDFIAARRTMIRQHESDCRAALLKADAERTEEQAAEQRTRNARKAAGKSRYAPPRARASGTLVDFMGIRTWRSF